MSSNNFKLKFSHCIVIFIICFILGLLLYNMLFIYGTESVKTQSASSEKNDNTSEISFVPINGNIQDNTFKQEIKDYDVKMSMISKTMTSEDTNKVINYVTPTVLTGNSNILNKFKNIDKYRIADENNICETFLGSNKLAYIYVDGNAINISHIKNLYDTISKYSKKNYAVIVYIDTEKEINKNYLKKLCSSKPTLIFTKGSNKTSFEMDNNCFIIYNSSYYSNAYTPLIDIVFSDNVPISMGVKLYIHDQNKKQSIIDDINSNTKNITKKLEESFVFFEIY